MKMLSVCAGIGGFDIAAEIAGIEVVGQVENNPFCIQILEKHWPHVKRIANLEDVQGDEFGTVDLLAGGIPCQPFSVAGKRRGTDDNRHLWPCTFALIQRMHPTWICIENVSNFKNMALELVCTDLEREGYEVETFVLPAFAVGAPHKRERCFVVAYSPCNRGNTWWTQRARQQGEVFSDSSRNSSSTMENSISTRCLFTRHINDGSLSKWENARWQQSTDNTRRPSKKFAVGNAHSERCEECDTSTSNREMGLNTWTTSQEWQQGKSQPRMGGSIDGLSNRMDGPSWPSLINELQHAWEPLRVLQRKIPNKSARLKALGNAIVPLQAYPILAAIVQAERMVDEGYLSSKPSLAPVSQYDVPN